MSTQYNGFGGTINGSPEIFVGTTGGTKAEIDYSEVMRKRLRIMGTSLRIRSMEEKAIATQLFAQHVVPLLASGGPSRKQRHNWSLPVGMCNEGEAGRPALSYLAHHGTETALAYE